MYLKDSGKDLYPPKFQPRGRPGLFMGYAQHKSIIILDLERFVKEGLRICVATRDFRVPAQAKFPLKVLMASIDPAPLWHFELPDHRGEEEPPDPDGEGDGPSRCRLCGLTATDEPLTCPECVRPLRRTSAKTTGHTRLADCWFGRCQCQAAVQEAAEGATEDVAIEEGGDDQHVVMGSILMPDVPPSRGPRDHRTRLC